MFFLPWLDRSKVKSIRYRGTLYKSILTLFIISFIGLGYLGTQPATPVFTNIARVLSVIYFGFFIFMPWYTKIDKTKPVPERIPE
jgi:ubiquinol-cytochrome c reductase cytochrome b subunit